MLAASDPLEFMMSATIKPGVIKSASHSWSSCILLTVQTQHFGENEDQNLQGRE